MNTLKRKLTAILLTFAMLFSLMPALPQAAEAAGGDMETVSNEYIDFSYQTPYAPTGAAKVKIIVKDVETDQQLGTTIVIDNYAKLLDDSGKENNILLKNNQYELDDVTFDIGYWQDHLSISFDKASFDWGFQLEDEATLTVYLRAAGERPNVPEEITGYGYTRTYRIYDDQLLKMLHSQAVDVTAATEIKAVKPQWVYSFGTESDKEFIDENRETDYWDITVTSNNAFLDEVQPKNIGSLEITYDNGQGESKVSISAGNLRYLIGYEASTPHYLIELNDDSEHVVYFYVSYEGKTNYNLYDVAFVKHGKTIADQMPETPEYNDQNQFINWEINSYDGDGEAFLSTTIVDEDMNVYARKVSSDYGGLEIRIMNEYLGGTNQFLDRLAQELNVSTDQIDKESIKVRVYGNSGAWTDEDHMYNKWNGVAGDGTEYYHVTNTIADDVIGPAHTDHISFSDVCSITVYFTLKNDNKMQTVSIPVGEKTGQLAKMMLGEGAGVGDGYLQLYVIQEGQVVSGESEDPDPEPPVEPTIDELRSLIEVAVNCQADEEHNKGSNAGTYALAEDTYDVIVDPDTNTATVTVQGQPYVNLLTKDFGVHQISGDISKRVVVKYTDEGWVLNDPSAATPMVLTFLATCSGGTTPEPGDAITGFTKDVVTAKVTEPALEIPEDVTISYPAGENNTVTAHEGDNVTLLYKITVEGKKDTIFTVKDDGAIFVGVSSDVKVTGESNEFTATIPEGGKVDLYVIKTFTDIKLDASPLTNNASIEIEGEGTIGPEKEIIEKVPVEVIPDGPTDEKLEALNLKVKLDCVSNVGHSNGTYDLTAESCSYEKDEIVAGENGIYTVPVVVDSEAYLAQYNKDHPDGKHIIKPETSDKQTITLTFNADKKTWLAEGVTSPIAFQVICSGTDAYDINNFTKTLVAGTEAEEEAAAAGVAVESYTIPEPNATVVVPADGSVTLLYKMTVTGNNNKDVNFVVTDKGATLASPESAGVRQEGNTFKGIVSAGKDVTFYVSKTFVVKDIDPEGNLVNLATIAGLGEDKDSTVDPGVDEITEEVPAEEGPALPDQNALNDMLDVVLDCASNVGHADGTYKDLLENSYDFGDVTHNNEGAYTVGVTIDSDKYIADYSNKVVKVAHEIQDETPATKTVILTYNKDQGNWTTAESPVKFLIVCEGVDWDISNIEKDLVTEATLGAAKTNGVSDDALKNITVPENTNDTVIIPEDGSVTLLYAITVNGKAGIAFSVEDPETTLVKSSANVSVDENADVATYTGLIPDNGTVTFYVSKNFIVDNITENGQLVNSATVAGDDGTTVNPGTEDDPANKDDEVIDGEEEDNRPTPPPYIPGGDDDDNPGDDDKPSGLNTEDHFSYVVGYEDGMVKPQRSITRAEVATIFYRLLEDDVRDDYDTTRNNFSDVTSDSWYNQTVSTLASMGILKGYEDGTFRPNASITRAEFAAIATRFFEETGATYEPGTFTDVTGDEWFAGAIMDAVNLGLIGGYEDGTVRPNNNITRAEACAIVNRTLGRVPDADHLLPADEMTTWPDNPSSAWFYADMQEATNGHEYEWITEDGNKIEEWTDILDKDWNDR